MERHPARTLDDGTTTVSMVLTAEDPLFLQELLAARRRGLTLVRTEPGGDEDPETDGPERRPEGDERSRPQQDYDTAVDAIRAGADATEPASPMHETVVTVTAAEVEARRGQGWAHGTMAGLPLPEAFDHHLIHAQDGPVRIERHRDRRRDAA